MSGLIRQFVYLSDAKYGLGTKDIEAILASSRRKNVTNDLTGLLIYSDGVFIQVLEGTSTAVESTFTMILDDVRHNNLEILANLEAQDRIFAKWDMAYIESTPELLGQQAGIKGVLGRPELLSLLSQDKSCITGFLRKFANVLGD